MKKNRKVPRVTSCIYRGDDWDFQYTRKVNGQVYNGSSSTWQAHLRDNQGNLIAEIVLDVTMANVGLIVLNLPGSITSTLSAVTYYSDLQETLADGRVYTRVKFIHPVELDQTHD